MRTIRSTLNCVSALSIRVSVALHKSSHVHAVTSSNDCDGICGRPPTVPDRTALRKCPHGIAYVASCHVGLSVPVLSLHYDSQACARGHFASTHNPARRTARFLWPRLRFFSCDLRGIFHNRDNSRWDRRRFRDRKVPSTLFPAPGGFFTGNTNVSPPNGIDSLANSS